MDGGMRLTCTSCGKVYVVDEGLRGRAFRMRCKRCDAVIAVTAEAVEALAASARATDPAPETGDADFADFSRELRDFADELEREAAPPPPPRPRPIAPVSETPPVLRAGDQAAPSGKGRSPRLLVAVLVAISASGAVAWHLASPSRSPAPPAVPVAPAAAMPSAPAPTDPSPAPAVADPGILPPAAAPAPTAAPPTAAVPRGEKKGGEKVAATGKPARVAASAPSVAAPSAPVASPRPDLPPRDPQEAQAALAARAGSFDGCVAEALRDEPGLLATPRPVVLTVTVRPNGRTAYPTLDDAQLTGTALGACVKRQAAALVFPESGGEALRVRTALLLGR